jgi:hypothetical protein
MRYRQPKEVFLGESLQRTILTPIPEADGHWMLCHPSVTVHCTECGAEPHHPCRSSRGHVVLTGGKARVLLRYIEGDRVNPVDLREAVKPLKEERCFRSRSHETRIKLWRDRGHARPSGTASDRRRKLHKLWRKVEWLHAEAAGDRRLKKTIEELDTLLRAVLRRNEDSI